MRADEPAVAAPGSLAAPPPVDDRRTGVGPLLGFLALAGIVAWFAANRAGVSYAPALLAPAALAAAFTVALKPAAAIVGLFALTGFSGSLLAYTPIPGRAAIDFILVVLWFLVAVKALSVREQSTWLLPGVVVLGAYIAVSVIGAFFAHPVADGIESIHLSVWLMASLMLVGLGSLPEGTVWTIARGALVVGALVAAYAMLRTVTGPTGAEREQALVGKPGFLQLKTQGSLPSAGHLALWCTALLPFALALALTLRDRWRYVAGATAAGTLFAVLATEVRTGIVAALAGALLVFACTGASKAFPSGAKAVRMAGVGLAAVILLAGAYATTIGKSGESSSRFERILDPTDDFAYSTRLTRWEEAFAVMADNPFGEGLGTLGAVAKFKPLDPELTRQLDSSYIKVGVEQGPWVLLLLAVGLVVLLANLVWRSITSVDPGRAALGIGAAGSLLGLIVSFYANTYIEEPQVLVGWLIVGLGIAALSHPGSSPPVTIGSDSAS